MIDAVYFDQMIMLYLFVVPVGLFISISLSFIGQSFGVESIVPFEKRLEDQLSNISNNTIANQNTNLVEDPSILQMPRNTTIQQIQINNETLGKLYNESIGNIEQSTIQTQENISQIRSILK